MELYVERTIRGREVTHPALIFSPVLLGNVGWLKDHLTIHYLRLATPRFPISGVLDTVVLEFGVGKFKDLIYFNDEPTKNSNAILNKNQWTQTAQRFSVSEWIIY